MQCAREQNYQTYKLTKICLQLLNFFFIIMQNMLVAHTRNQLRGDEAT